MTIEEVKRPTVTLDFSDPVAVKEFIMETKSGMYVGKNVEGEEIMILHDQGDGFELYTDQSNGWTRLNTYDSNGYCDGETFKGRWRK